MTVTEPRADRGARRATGSWRMGATIAILAILAAVFVVTRFGPTEPAVDAVSAPVATNS